MLGLNLRPIRLSRRAEPFDSNRSLAHIENDRVRFNLRVQDLSRRADTWGTEVPVVRESGFTHEAISLINVPADNLFRLMLRVYESDSAGQARVRIDVFRQSTDERLGTVETALPTREPVIYNPGYAQISITDLFPNIHGQDRLRITVTPTTPGANIWAFVSVTNDDTQQVTTITPQ